MVESAEPRAHSRNQAIEILRIASAIAVVAFHSGAPGREITYSGLIVFLTLSPCLDLKFNWDLKRNTSALFVAFIVPWIFWMAVYGVLNIWTHKPFLPGRHLFLGLMHGTSGHLWFMPAMFAVLTVLNHLKPYVNIRVLFWLSATAASSLLFTAAIWRPESSEWIAPLPQWAHAIPAVFVGIILGLLGRVPRLDAVVGVSVIGAALSWMVAENLPGMSLPYLIGTLFTALAMYVGPRFIPRRWDVQAVSACMLGVYLSHIAWLFVCSKFIKPGSYLAVAIVCLAAFASTWAAQRILPFMQLFVGSAMPRTTSRKLPWPKLLAAGR